MSNLYVWLDDERPLPPDYDILVKTSEQAIELLKTGNVVEISLDHDLGEGYSTGYEVAKWIEENAYNWSLNNNTGLSPIRVRIHSQNPSGVINMKMAIRNAYKYWKKLS